MAYYPGKEIIREKLETHDVGEISRMLDVHPSHIYNVEERGVSKPLHDAMAKRGWLPNARRYRLHYECGRGESGRERYAMIRAEMCAAGCDSISDYVDLLRGLRNMVRDLEYFEKAANG